MRCVPDIGDGVHPGSGSGVSLIVVTGMVAALVVGMGASSEAAGPAGRMRDVPHGRRIHAANSRVPAARWGAGGASPIFVGTKRAICS